MLSEVEQIRSEQWHTEVQNVPVQIVERFAQLHERGEPRREPQHGPSRFVRLTWAFAIGAGDGNRTRVLSLGNKQCTTPTRNEAL